MKTAIAVLIGVFTLLSAVGYAQDHQDYSVGNGLLETCTSYDPHNPATHDAAGLHFASSALCMGYVTGVADSLGVQGTLCTPAGVSTGQLTDVVIKYLRDNAENRHLPSVLLVTTALVRTWPCEKKEGKGEK